MEIRGWGGGNMHDIPQDSGVKNYRIPVVQLFLLDVETKFGFKNYFKLTHSSTYPMQIANTLSMLEYYFFTTVRFIFPNRFTVYVHT